MDDSLPLVGADCSLANTQETTNQKASPAHSYDSGFSDIPESALMDPFDVLACSPLSSLSGENNEAVDSLLLDSPVPDAFDALDSEIASYLNGQDTFVNPVGNCDQLMNTPQVSTIDPFSLSPEPESMPDVQKQCENVSAFQPVNSLGPGVDSSVEPTSTTVSIKPQNLPTVKVVKVVKAWPTSTKAETEKKIHEALDERNRKNAIQAKINREKKKSYINGLESEINELKKENEHLKHNNQQVVQEKSVLLEEIEYLKNVLANQSTLSNLLQNIENVKTVRLTSSFSTRKRNTEHDHDYQLPVKRSRSEKKKAGVCLHVENNNVSLEFCSNCSKMSHLKDV